MKMICTKRPSFLHLTCTMSSSGCRDTSHSRQELPGQRLPGQPRSGRPSSHPHLSTTQGKPKR